MKYRVYGFSLLMFCLVGCTSFESVQTTATAPATITTSPLTQRVTVPPPGPVSSSPPGSVSPDQSRQIASSQPTVPSPSVMRVASAIGPCLHRAVTPTTESTSTLYFRVDNTGWFVTRDAMATSQRFAPYGSLSRDRQHLVTVNCRGSATLCIASPPDAELHTLPVHLPAEQTGASLAVDWLPNNERFLLWAGTVSATEGLQARLYWVDASTGQTVELAENVDRTYLVSSVDNCVGYSSFDDDVRDSRFHLVSLEGYQVGPVWRAPDDAASLAKWPQAEQPIDWSVDGRRLAYYRPDANAIYVWDLFTGDQEDYDIGLRGEGPGTIYALRWSRDGRLIFLQSAQGHWLLELQTKTLRQLAKSTGIGPGRFYNWLPGGKSLIVIDGLRSQRLWLDGSAEEPLSYPGVGERKLIDALAW